jgi:MoxR-like ATPase
MESNVREISAEVERETSVLRDLASEVSKIIVGQKPLIERVVIGLISEGHLLVEGVPGLAKTLLIRTLAGCFDARFQRIQFTPDLLPADLIGTLVFDQRDSSFRPHKGPVFANIILADEINRAPAKVQSALLEAMQERQVTIGDETYPLPRPFLVMATQNPIEQEGTYPLPEAQVDRFMMKLVVRYPGKDDEREIMDRMSGSGPAPVRKICGPEEVEQLRQLSRRIYVDNRVRDYIVDLVHATRNPEEAGVDAKGLVQYGASPRAALALGDAARGHALLQGRGYVVPEDVKAVGADVLRHRVILTYEAEAEEVTPDEVIRRVFDSVEVP